MSAELLLLHIHETRRVAEQWLTQMSCLKKCVVTSLMQDRLWSSFLYLKLTWWKDEWLLIFFMKYGLLNFFGLWFTLKPKLLTDIRGGAVCLQSVDRDELVFFMCLRISYSRWQWQGQTAGEVATRSYWLIMTTKFVNFTLHHRLFRKSSAHNVLHTNNNKWQCIEELFDDDSLLTRNNSE